MLNGDLSKVLGIYYGATEVPVFYMDISGGIKIQYPAHFDDHVLMEFFGFTELLEFIKPIFSRHKEGVNLETVHIFQTHHCFTYAVIFLNSVDYVTGAVISGPMHIFPPHERRVEEILVHNGMHPDKKPELIELLKSVPSTSENRIQNYGKLLFTLSKFDTKSLDMSEPEVYREDGIPGKELLCSIFKTSVTENVKNIFRYSSKFIRDAGKRIIAGDVKGMNELLGKSEDILWYTGTSMDILNTLKNKCIVICGLSCIYAIHGKTPYKRAMYMLNRFIDQIETLRTADEIVAFMIAVMKEYTHAVYAVQNAAYSMHVNRVLKYIRNHYTEKITLEKLAEYVRKNPVYLSSLFMKETKISLSDHINKTRVNESIKLLEFSDKSINEIAYAVGYSYQNHFSAMFKKFTGMTPQEYRKNYKKTKGSL
ncbi:MAG TPA: helix-turn-helix domain-containing protein [Clostridia bacterium]|nr:helix-turn-helix domain-containing protein [Clostridia bacterium]